MGASSSSHISRHEGYTGEKQRALKRACMFGDLRAVQELLDVQPSSKSRSWRCSGPWSRRPSSAPSSSSSDVRLDWLYEEDLGASPLMYLACGTPLVKAMLDGSLEPQEWACARAGAARTAAARLQVLQWLLSMQQSHLWGQLALGAVSHTSQTVLHCLLLNGGHVDMLQHLLQWWASQDATAPSEAHRTSSHHKQQPSSVPVEAPTIPAKVNHGADDKDVCAAVSTGAVAQCEGRTAHALAAVLSVVDHLGRTPLDLALLSCNWQAAKLLISAGMPQDWSWLPPAVVSVTRHLQAVPDQSGKAACQLPRLMEVLFPHQRPASLMEAMQQLPSACHSLIRVLSGYGARPQETHTLTTVDKKLAQSLTSAGVDVSVKSLGEAEVLGELHEAVQQVCATMGLDEASALKLLSAHSYDVDAVLAQHMATSNFDTSNFDLTADEPNRGAAGSVAGAGGVNGRSHHSAHHDGDSQRAGVQSAQGTACCEVCWEQLPRSLFSVDLVCGHHTCDDCWRGVLRAHLDQGDPWHTTCPHEGCGLMLPTHYAKQLLPPEDHQRLYRLLTSHYVTQHPRSTWCPRPGCGNSVHLSSTSNAGDASSMGSGVSCSHTGTGDHRSSTGPDEVHVALLAGRGVSVQCACGTRFCFRCGGPPHEPVSCLQVEVFSDTARRAGAEATDAYLSARTRKCIKCQARTERTEGCNHMVCARCGAHWCWACGGDWALHGRHTGGYYQCWRGEQVVREGHERAPSRAQVSKQTLAAVDQQVARWAEHRRFVNTAHALAGHAAFVLHLLRGRPLLTAATAFPHPLAYSGSMPTSDGAARRGGAAGLLDLVSKTGSNGGGTGSTWRNGSSSSSPMLLGAAHGGVGAGWVGWTQEPGAADAQGSMVQLMRAAQSPASQQLLEQWLQMVCRASETLAWSHLLLIFMLPGSASWIYLRRKVECLQRALDRLAQPLLGLPHADHVMAAAAQRQRAAAGTAPAGAPSLRLVHLVDALFRQVLAGASGPHPRPAGEPAAAGVAVGAGSAAGMPGALAYPEAAGTHNVGTHARRPSARNEEQLPWEDTLQYQLVMTPPLYASHHGPDGHSSLQHTHSLGSRVRRVLHGGSHDRAVAGQMQDDAGAPIGSGADLQEQLPYVMALFGAHGGELQGMMDEVVKSCAVILRVARLGHLAGGSGIDGHHPTSGTHQQAGPQQVLSTVVQATRGAALLAWQSARSLMGQLVSGSAVNGHLHED